SDLIHKNAVNVIVDKHGKLDILVNKAAILDPASCVDRENNRFDEYGLIAVGYHGKLNITR
ncbi:hypothetical protein RJ639_022851, partial [Escallonia herrerae]